MQFDYIKHTIYLVVSGSQAYGTNIPGSDTDYKGIIVPPVEIDNGFIVNFEQKEGLDGYGKDSVAYEIRKFFRLAADCNPNIIETLFTPADLVILRTLASDKLVENRSLFLSKRAKHSFHGYAYAQLKRIKLHKKWWDKEKAGDLPPKPDRLEYGLPLKPKYPKDQLNSLIAVPSLSLAEDEREYIYKERRYAEDKLRYDKWKQWRDNRNPERAALEAKYGYDAKHAMHLVRLMTMCEEILKEGTVLVRRPDAEFLKSIRSGAWEYDRLMEWVEEQDYKLAELEKNTELPKYPDMNKLNDLCIDLVKIARAR